MKRKWWIAAIAAMAICVILLGIFWDTILIYAFPKVILSKALGNTFSQLQQRMTDNPLELIVNSVDLQGSNTIDLCLDTNHSLLGDIQYNMGVQTATSPRRILAEGSVISKTGKLDLSVYLDPNFAAIASDSLLDGNYYGVTYVTFPEDVRSFPFLPLLIGQSTIKEWEASVSELRDTMNEPHAAPTVSSLDFRMALGGILSIKPEVFKDSLTLCGEKREVHRLDFSAPGTKIADAAREYETDMSEMLRDLIEELRKDPDSFVNASAYVYDETVVKLSADIVTEDTRLQGELFLGENPAKDPIQLSLVSQKEDNLNKWSVDVQTAYDAKSFAEKIAVVHIENGVQERNIIDYTWDMATGELKLDKEGEEETVFLTLRPAEDGILVSTEQFEDLMALLGAENQRGDSRCQMRITKGSSIYTPEYKNLDQWSGDDLLTLLSGLGSLLGLGIE